MPPKKPKDATDSKAKDGYIAQATVNLLARIEALKAAIVAQEYAWTALTRTPDERHHEFILGRDAEVYRNAWLLLRGKLFEALNQAESQAAMWGVLSGDKALQRKAIKAATRFVSHQNAEIMSYLTLDGVHPGSYLTNAHDAFRKELNKAIERETGDPVKGAQDE
jgi:hypothetical protein